MRIEYQDPSEASDAINDLLAQLADARNANRALLAQLDEERASHAKSQEAYDNATAKLADQLAEARNTIYRWESHDFEDDVDDATAPILAELADARAQLADMTRRKDGWRGVAMLYRGEVRRLVDSLIDRSGSSSVETWFRFWSRLRRIFSNARK